jgi:hypothetical protein
LCRLAVAVTLNGEPPVAAGGADKVTLATLTSVEAVTPVVDELDRALLPGSGSVA